MHRRDLCPWLEIQFAKSFILQVWRPQLMFGIAEGLQASLASPPAQHTHDVSFVALMTGGGETRRGGGEGEGEGRGEGSREGRRDLAKTLLRGVWKFSKNPPNSDTSHSRKFLQIICPWRGAPSSGPAICCKLTIAPSWLDPSLTSPSPPPSPQGAKPDIPSG